MTPKLIDYKTKPGDYYEQIRFEMMQFLPKNANTILDIGCSGGYFCKELGKKQKLETWGIEPNEKIAKIAKKNLNKFFQGTLEDNYKNIPKNHFDAIFFNDVLEHIVDPYEILAMSKDKLNENGVIIASVPNVRFIKNLKNLLLDKDWKYEDEGILDRTHLRFFTRKSIIRMFEDTGFEIKKIKGINKSNTTLKKIFNILTFGIFNDTMYLQYAVVAKARK